MVCLCVFQNLLIDNNRDFSTLQDDLDQQRLGEETESLKKGWAFLT